MHSVYHTAAAQGYGEGLVYRERALFGNGGVQSLYGLVGTCLFHVGGLFFAMLMPLPFFPRIIHGMSDIANSSNKPRVRQRLFSGFRSTGRTTLNGVGISKSGKARVDVKLNWDYDGGLGMTMLSACTLAAEIVERQKWMDEGGKGTGWDDGEGESERGVMKPLNTGVVTPVVAVGAEALAQAFRKGGALMQVSFRSAL